MLSQSFKLVVMLMALIGSLAACDCMTKRSVEVETKGCKAVFLATCIKTELNYKNGDTNDYDVGGGKKVTFLVKKMFKGKLKEKIEVYTGLSSASCGNDFRLGEQYLIYAAEYEGKLMTNICMRTRIMNYENTTANQKEINEIVKFSKK